MNILSIFCRFTFNNTAIRIVKIRQMIPALIKLTAILPPIPDNRIVICRKPGCFQLFSDLLRIPTGVGEAAAIFLGPDSFNDPIDGGLEGVRGSFGGFMQKDFDSGEDLLNEVEVGRIYQSRHLARHLDWIVRRAAVHHQSI